MFFYEGQSCPVCGMKFAETDDIVTCPVCGAPHHRSCWQKDGHCHFESAHGTDRQWQRVPPPEEAEESPLRNRCPNCGTDNPEHAEFCSRCGRSLNVGEWSAGEQPPQYGQSAPYHEYTPFRMAFDPLGGVSRDEMFEDVSAEELAICVGSNTTYYLPRFCQMKEGRSVRWNWAAFLITPYWLLYRKQYVAGTLVSLFYLLFDLLVNAIFGISGVSGTEMNYEKAAALAYEAGFGPILLLLCLAMVVLCFGFGLFGTRLYMHSCLKKVRRIREADPADYRQTLRHDGGVSFIWGALTYFSLSILSSLLGTFLLLL